MKTPKSSTKTLKPMRTMKDFFTAVESSHTSKSEGRPKKEPPSSNLRSTTLLGTPLRPGPFTVHKSGSAKPKTLLQKIREKEIARKELKENQDPERNKRLAMLHALKRTIVEVVFSHFNLRRVRGMDLEMLRSLVVLSCGEMNRKLFTEHVDLLCELCPSICSKDSCLGKVCLRLAGTEHIDAVLRRIDAELTRLE